MTDVASEAPEIAEPDAVAVAFGTDPARGLSAEEVAARRLGHGENRLREPEPRRAIAILLAQFRGLIVWLLAGAAGLSLAVGDLAEAAAIGAVLALNAAIGFVTELRATRSIEALHRIAEVRTRVRRDGVERFVDARALVPGDVVILEAGDIVSADMRLLATAGLEADQSVLTGESVPVPKNQAPVQGGQAPGDRANMVFRGSAIAQGTATALVTATGMATELGRITELVAEARPTASPLERRLGDLGQRLVWLSLGLAAATGIAGVVRGLDPVAMAETAIALAVAAVPEGLPVVASLCLARGLWRIMRRNALITRLSAVETLGSVTVILTDKTGTLTENRMSARRYLLAEGAVEVLAEGRVETGDNADLALALEIGVLCATASLDAEEKGGAGDPMELALLAAGRAAGIERAELLKRYPLDRDHAFDQRLRMMATVHRTPEGGHLIAVKGAPEAVIAAATHAGAGGRTPLGAEERSAWLAEAAEAAGEGYRVLALARRTSANGPTTPYEELALIGLVCLADPLRADVPEAIAACREAGIRVVMLTGDHAATAAAIAREAGIAADGARAVTGPELGDPDRLEGPELEAMLSAEVFARITPEQKLGLARLLQGRGEIVAMTGDGVNDAPSLRQADIGIAMGGRGTEVARQVAQMVLRDDRFPTIVAAVREGRIIFDNIRRFVVYLMSCNVSEVLVVGLAVAAGLPVPLLPLQILYLNLVTDVFPAFAVGLARGAGNVMALPPRPPAEPIVDRGRWVRIGALGAIITAAVLTAYAVALGDPGIAEDQAVTVAFLATALAQLWNVFNLRAVGSGLLRNEITRNPLVWGAILLCLALIGAALWLPPFAAIMGLPNPGPRGYAIALAASLAPLAIWQVVLAFLSLRAGRQSPPVGLRPPRRRA